MTEENTAEGYINPLVERYASREMSELFGEKRKFSTWRRLWVVLAETQMELGLPITQEQVDELRTFQNRLNIEEARSIEKECRHDVVAHIRAYGLQCPQARGIIHLGATSAYVTDNADIIIMREALGILKKKAETILSVLRKFALHYKSLPTLGFTHFQPAQLTTVGKRACLWIQDLVMDHKELGNLIDWMPLRGVKGTTGTQASFLRLFDGDGERVKRLDGMVTEKMGFVRSFPVTGQTYPRKVDSRIAACLSGLAQSAHRFSNDIRLLQHLQEVEEPFGKTQVGSSAMPYKRNPMRSERMAALSRFLITMEQNPAFTQAQQWFERTLDDSANRRIVLPQMFLCADGIIDIYLNVASGLQVYERIIKRHVEEELPFIATEEILMKAVQKGGDRQFLHEKIRTLSMETVQRMRESGAANDLLKKLADDEEFSLTKEDLDDLSQPERYIGRSQEQVEEFISQEVDPILSETDVDLDVERDLRV